METIIERIKGFLTEKGIAEKDLYKLKCNSTIKYNIPFIPDVPGVELSSN